MRIWIINQDTPHPEWPGSTRHYNLAKELVREGHEVEIIAANFSHFKREKVKDESKEKNDAQAVESELDGVTFQWINVPSYEGNGLKRLWSMFCFAFKVWRRDFDFSKKPDVIIGSSPQPFSALAAYELAKSFNCPFVFEVRDLWPETLIQLGHFSPKHPLVYCMKKIEVFLYQHADHIITLLPGSVDYINEYVNDLSKISWLPNFFDFSALPTQTPAQNLTFTYMYAGAHGLANNLDLVLDAAKIIQEKNMSNIVIQLIGDGPERDRLRARVRNELIRNVQFLEPVSKRLVYQVLSTADAMIFCLQDSPVFKWGLSPNKLFDYLGMGKPVIATTHSEHDIASRVDCGLCVPPNDPMALANAMIELSQMPEEERIQKGERGREYVKTYHDISAQVEKLMFILSSLNSEVTR